MKKILIFISLFFIPILLQSQDIGGDYYVATDGSDSDPGTYAEPFATLQKAVNVSVPGDTTYVRSGTYYLTNEVNLNPNTSNGVSGTAGNPICYFNYPGEAPILDYSTAPEQTYNTGISLANVEFIHFKGLTIRNLYQFQTGGGYLAYGIGSAYCANLTFENMTIHDVSGRAFSIWGAAWNSWDSAYAVDVLGGNPEDNIILYDYDTTRFINCDVYNLCDSLSPNPGNAADGWKVGTNMGNYFLWQGCRAWNYSDDGFDPSGQGTRVFENCWTMSSQKYAGIDPEGDGIEGNGFKTTALREHTIPYYDGSRLVITRNCLALFCDGTGFAHGVESDSSDNVLWISNTAYQCGTGFATVGMGLDSVGDAYRNNIAYKSTALSSAPVVPVEVFVGPYSNYEESNNTWDEGGRYFMSHTTDTVTVTDADFVTTDSATLVSLFTAARQSDGSLPVNRPLILAEGSDLIDAGTQVFASDDADFVLSYNGLAPDIGYTEYGDAEITYVDSVVITATGGATTISVDNGTLQMIDTVWPLDASFLDVTWSVINGTGSASINSSGLVTAITDGTVTIKATAQDGRDSSDTWGLTLSNQDVETVPTVITSVSSAIHSTHATSGGNVTDNGGAAVTAKGICWSTSPNPTIADRHTIDGTGDGVFVSRLFYLNNSTTYYVRAYATNSEGTAYGDNRQVNTTDFSTQRYNGTTLMLNGKAIVL